MKTALSLVLLAAGVVACTVTTSGSPEPTTAPSPEGDGGVPPARDAGPAPDADGKTDAGSGACDAPITAPPASLGLDAFYVKYLDADGLPVIGSGKPSDAALRQACRIVRQMLSFRPEIRTTMIGNGARVAVMARTEVTTDIPEHADLNTAFPGTDWDERARGLGGTLQRPATSCAEENLLCEATDPYKGENILVHELAHGIDLLGVRPSTPTWEARLKDAYAKAIAAGKWEDTYAATNIDEYFAEGVQSYFETNLEATPPNGIHNDVDTRAELLAYDPALHALVAEVFGPAAWAPTCP